MNMKTMITLSGAIMLAMGTAAFAGFVQPAPVDVDLAGGVALGDQLTARIDPDPDVFIGCGTRTISTGGGILHTGFCQAEDSAGDHVLCFTTDPGLLEAMHATSDFAFITFSFVDDGAGGFTCTRVGHSTQSFYLPDFSKFTKK